MNETPQTVISLVEQLYNINSNQTYFELFLAVLETAAPAKVITLTKPEIPQHS